MCPTRSNTHLADRALCPKEWCGYGTELAGDGVFADLLRSRRMTLNMISGCKMMIGIPTVRRFLQFLLHLLLLTMTRLGQAPIYVAAKLLLLCHPAGHVSTAQHAHHQSCVCRHHHVFVMVGTQIASFPQSRERWDGTGTFVGLILHNGSPDPCRR